MSTWQDAQSVLAIRLDNAGDVIMTGPALRAVKERLPDSRITLLASAAGSAMTPLLPWIDDVMISRVIWQDVNGAIPFDPAEQQRFIESLAARRFDAALIFTSFSQSPHVAGYVCYLAGIPLRAGQSKEFAGSCLTDEFRDVPDEVHQIERNLRLVEGVGFPVADRNLSIEIPDEAAERGRVLRRASIPENAPYVVIHPGASAESRRYPPEKFGDVANLLLKKGHRVLVTGVPTERPLIEALMGRAPEAIALPMDMSAVSFAALLKGSSVVICNNSLPIHLADAAKTPLVALFSGTDLESQWGPRQTPHALLRRHTPCHPCYRFDCPIGTPCLDISPEEVVSAAEKLIVTLTPDTRNLDWSGSTPQYSRNRLHLPGTYSSPLGLKETPKRIAIFRALHLGDMLLAVPALRSIRDRFPRAEITLIGLPWARQFVDRYRAYLDRFVEFPGCGGIEEAQQDGPLPEDWVREQQSYGYDLAVQMHGSGLTSNAVVQSLGADVSVGFHPSEADPNPTLNLQAPYPTEDHEILRSLQLARMVGATDLPTDLEFPLLPADLAEADILTARLRDTDGPLVVLHPSARSVDRRWPQERFGRLADSLINDHSAAVILTGSRDDVDLVEEITDRMRFRALNLAGKTSLGGLAAVTATASLFVGNDSGPAHLAHAVSTPTVILFGPEDPRRWGPLTGNHRVLRGMDAEGRWTVDSIGLDEVSNAARELLEPVHHRTRSESPLELSQCGG